MESKLGNILFLLVGTILFSACNNTIDNYEDYMKYMANPDNGLVKEKSNNGLTFRVKYLPVDYLAYKEYKGNENLNIDSIKKTYENSITFMMVVGPGEGKKFDVTKVGVSSYEEYAQRIELMNFGMQENVLLKVSGNEVIADLAQMESVYGLEKERKILFVFPNKEEGGQSILTDDITFVYKDEIFYTGVNQFKFSINDIKSIPAFQF